MIKIIKIIKEKKLRKGYKNCKGAKRKRKRRNSLEIYKLKQILISKVEKQLLNSRCHFFSRLQNLIEKLEKILLEK